MRPKLIQMAALLLYLFTVLLSMTVYGEESGPQTYATCYQNITSDRQESGFIQLIGLAINKTKLFVGADNASFIKPYDVLIAGFNAEALNYTPPFNDALRKPDPVAINSTQITNFGITVSSDDPLHVYSVKADKGTTDGYMVLPLTNNSVEFMIVGWPRLIDRPFLATVMAVPALDGTCIELYKIHENGAYERVASAQVDKYQLFRYFANTSRYVADDGSFQEDSTKGEDLTGYYMNSSKPIEVIFGHECAWVPDVNNLFCDYMADTMIPISHLGRVYIVPMILGRSTAAGYVVRVVPAQNNTDVSYLSTSQQVQLGHFLEFEQPRTDQATVVVCSKPCAVYQYNKGYLQYNDVPTDPYMTMITPVDRFTAGAPFATASFCLEKGVLTTFNNFVAIVTYPAYKDNIRFDDEPVNAWWVSSQSSVPWTEIDANGEKMYITSFHIDHGYHFVSMAPGQSGSFAVYAYGHSSEVDSSSAYGFACNFNSTGIPISTTYAQDREAYIERGDPTLNTTCLNERYLIDSITSGGSKVYVPFPFTLKAGINPAASLTPSCLAQYHDQLLKMLQDFSHKINYWICISKNCSYLFGEGVAINYDTLKVDFIGTAGVYTAVEVYVELMASYDVRVDYYATCRAEIMDYMYYFVNWPPQYTEYLITETVGSGCPWPLKFQEPKFINKPPECPKLF